MDSLWQRVYRDKFERFLNNTGQRQGDLVLSLPIGGEGRTGPGYTGRVMVAVTYPARPADADLGASHDVFRPFRSSPFLNPLAARLDILLWRQPLQWQRIHGA